MINTRKSILYIDDEEINLRVFKNTFRRDYTIFTARSAKDGMKILENQSIDLIITDQRMPDITGVQFLSMVQEKYPEIPPGRLIISGYSDYEDIEMAYKKYKLFQFIAKPWDQNELKIIIQKAIANDA
ncbi:MAG TPA: response regulator [Prolixibacteraceae bacterium]|nr:response regulator [Prolixibacteraceae bacterium]